MGVRFLALLQLKSITVAFGGPAVLEDVNLTVERGERLCLLGRNGSGKSTLMRVIHGSLEPDDGRVIIESRARVAMLDQRVPSDLTGTVEEVVTSGAGCTPHRTTEPHVARATLSRAGLDGRLDVGTLSAGLRRRVLIASAIASDADVLLLDEPTNHLDLDSIAWLESLILREQKTILFVTHDRAFLRRIATGIVDLDRGNVSRFEADYDKYLDRKQSSRETESRTRAQFDKVLSQEEAWIRQGVRERRKRNIGRVSRLEGMRAAHQARRSESDTARMTAQEAGRTGRKVIEAKDVTFAWDGRPIVSSFSTRIMRGDRIGFMGPNGSGKTTLVRLLLHELEPTSGVITHGTNLEVAYFDQLHATLDPSKSVADNIGDGSATITVNGKTRQVIGYLAEFLFTADQARNPIAHLSGGERNRLLLARLFARPSNVLVLDEPTNDLDVETLEVLEDLLANYGGTVLIVSHDRELLDHVATSTLVMEGKGRVGEYAGGYSDWLRQCKPLATATKAKSKKRKAKVPTKHLPKLSKEERKELRELPARIERLEHKQAALHATMADPTYFQQSGDALARDKATLASLDASITAAYARWEDLDGR